MPLSDEEQRILNEIERRFYDHDREFHDTIGSTTLFRALGRNCKWAALGFVAGLIILMVSFASSILLGAFGFGVMLISAIIFTQNARKMGRAGLQELTQSMRSHSLGELLGDTRKRLRERFKREE